VYSKQYGVTSYPDPNQTFQKRYYKEDFVDDRIAKMIGIRYCLNTGSLMFKGFQARFQTTKGPVVQTYGTMDDITNDANVCSPAIGVFTDLTEDLAKFAIYVDSNDIEGLLFVTATNK